MPLVIAASGPHTSPHTAWHNANPARQQYFMEDHGTCNRTRLGYSVVVPARGALYVVLAITVVQLVSDAVAGNEYANCMRAAGWSGPPGETAPPPPEVRQASAAYKAGNYEEAARGFRSAADLGDAVGQNNLGALYKTGFGVAQDDAEAVKWFRQAADQGNALAQRNLGTMYATGRGVALDYAEALTWFRLSADQGNAAGQTAVATIYVRGFGVAQDDVEAMKWFRLAADQGNAMAQYGLGVGYRTGRGVPEDDAEAAKWYGLAARQGIPAAQFSLAGLYLQGKGVETNNARGWMWLDIAASHDHPKAGETRDAMVKQMTPAQHTAVQDMSRRCLASHYQDCGT
jgi:TPR repeat protein